MIGFHIGIGGNATGVGDHWRRLDAAAIPFTAKSVDNFPKDAQDIAAASATAHMVIFRRVSPPAGATPPPGGSADVPPYHEAPDMAARMQWGWHKKYLPPEFDKRVTWLETINEPAAYLRWPAGQAPRWALESERPRIERTIDGQRVIEFDNAPWLAQFALTHAQLANELGYKWLAFGWSGGEPEPEQWTSAPMLAFLRYAAANRAGCGVALHEYSFNNAHLFDGKNWMVGRYRRLFEACRAANIGRPLVCLTEFGWRQDSAPGVELAIPQLMDAHAELARDGVRGAAIWYLGGGFGDIHKRVQPMIAPLTNALIAAGPPPEPPPPPPPQPPAFDEHLRAVVEANVAIPLNKDAALQRAIYATGWVPNTAEIRTTYGGQNYAVQGARQLTSDTWRAYFARVGDWGNVAWVAWDEHTGPVEPPPPPAPDPPLNGVEPLSQRAAAWAALPLGQPTGHGLTIGGWGCLLVVYNMMARHAGLTTALPAEYNAHMVAVGAFSRQFILPAALRTAHPTRVKYHGYLTRSDAGMLAKIDTWLNAGRPVPARVDFDPKTPAHEQHWVLVTGHRAGRLACADPWTGRAGWIDEIYGIDGPDILEAIFYEVVAAPAPVGIDLRPYFWGINNAMQWVLTNDRGAGEDCQIQTTGRDAWQLVKNRNVERFTLTTRNGRQMIGRTVDTSPGRGRIYTLADDGANDSAWAPAVMAMGEVYTRRPVVTFYDAASCRVLSQTRQITTIKLVRTFETFDNWVWAGRQNIPRIVLDDCVLLQWDNLEQYVLSRRFGYLVAWRRLYDEPAAPLWSVITEINTGRPPLIPAPVPCV